jgi:hypothetical protein
MARSLVFVYNADSGSSGLFNTLTDIAHKLISPHTYSRNLCALTHSNPGMRKEWKELCRLAYIDLHRKSPETARPVIDEDAPAQDVPSNKRNYILRWIQGHCLAR